MSVRVLVFFRFLYARPGAPLFPSLLPLESSSTLYRRRLLSCLFSSKFKKSIHSLVMYAISERFPSSSSPRLPLPPSSTEREPPRPNPCVTVVTRERPLCSYNDVIYTCRPLSSLFTRMCVTRAKNLNRAPHIVLFFVWNATISNFSIFFHASGYVSVEAAAAFLFWVSLLRCRLFARL